MKPTLPSLLLFCILPLSISAAEEPEKDAEPIPITGRWLVTEIDGEGVEGRPRLAVKFNEDGTLVRWQGVEERKGSYEISDDRKQMKSSLGEGGEVKVSEILVLNKTTLKIKDNRHVVTMIRLDDDEEDEKVEGEEGEPAEDGAEKRSGDIVGDWRLTAIQGRELPESEATIVTSYAEDGSCRTRDGKPISEGTYTLSEDKTVLIVKSGTNDPETSKVIALTDTTLVLQMNKFIEMTFTRE